MPPSHPCSKWHASRVRVFRQAQAAFTRWSKLPAEERTPEAILSALDFEFFELLDSVTIARSRRHIEAHYDTTEIGTFPTRRPPISFRPPLTERADVPPFDVIYEQLRELELACYTPGNYILPSRLSKYEQSYGDDLEGIARNVSLTGQQKGIKALMTVNLLKRLESSVHSFRITLGKLAKNNQLTLAKIVDFQSGKSTSATVVTHLEDDFDPEDDDMPDLEEASLGGKADIALADMDLTSWKRDLEKDLAGIRHLIAEMEKVTPGHDAKLQHLLTHIQQKVENPIHWNHPLHHRDLRATDRPQCRPQAPQRCGFLPVGRRCSLHLGFYPEGKSGASPAAHRLGSRATLHGSTRSLVATCPQTKRGAPCPYWALR